MERAITANTNGLQNKTFFEKVKEKTNKVISKTPFSRENLLVGRAIILAGVSAIVMNGCGNNGSKQEAKKEGNAVTYGFEASVGDTVNYGDYRILVLGRSPETLTIKIENKKTGGLELAYTTMAAGDTLPINNRFDVTFDGNPKDLKFKSGNVLVLVRDNDPFIPHPEF